MSAPVILRDATDFADAGLITRNDTEAFARVGARYSVAMSADLAALVDRTDPADPIAAQFVPDIRELDIHPAERTDPIADNPFSPLPGLVHRYDDRVLLKIVSACPVYCRFCFRRESVGEGKGGLLPRKAVDDALAYIALHPRIREVILTGGDPLALAPRRLAELMQRLDAIDHVRTIRIHTRVPVVLPGDITDAMIDALRPAKTPVYVVVHANHPRELSDAARAACGKIVDAGIPLLSQSVLLAGVNDSVDVLVALMRAFVEARIKPYYLHHPDLAPGTAHFRLPIARGRELVAAMQSRLSGIARPHYVLDLPGGYGKVPLEAAHANPSGEEWTIRDRNGRIHPYADAVSKKPDYD